MVRETGKMSVMERAGPGAAVLVSMLAAFALAAFMLAGVRPAAGQQDRAGQGSIINIGELPGGSEGDAGELSAGPCGNRQISIASMQWPSSIILAQVHAQILSGELGCDVSVVPGDMAATASSMATTGQPAIAPELWIERIASIWNPVLETGHVRAEAASMRLQPGQSL